MEFEEFHLSEVQNMASEEKLEEVLSSMKNNRVAIKGNISNCQSFQLSITHVKFVQAYLYTDALTNANLAFNRNVVLILPVLRKDSHSHGVQG